MTVATDDEIRAALEQLRTLIAARVRGEQLRDQLTGLPNLAALNETVRTCIEQNASFWVAFVEIDRFKTINDRFGYASADALLRKVADALQMACSWFRGTTTAFRAHGDEFYLLGIDVTDETTISTSLELLRKGIAAITLPVGKAGEMVCTVSVGWATNADLTKLLTDRTLMAALEYAVAEAKLTRDCVVRYTPALSHSDTVTLRSDCGACKAKFSVDVKTGDNQPAEDFWCPNCGARTHRPPVAERVSITPATV